MLSSPTACGCHFSSWRSSKVAGSGAFLCFWQTVPPQSPVSLGSSSWDRGEGKRAICASARRSHGSGAEADPQTCSKGNQGSLIAHHTRECPQLPRVPFTLLSQVDPPRGAEAWGGRRSPYVPQPQGRHCSLQRRNCWLIHSCCSAWPPHRETLWTDCSRTPSHSPLGCSCILCCNSRAADQPRLSILESCRRCLRQGCLTHGTWADPPQEVTHPTPLLKPPGTPLPCPGDVPLGPIARKVLAGCHSPVQKHRHLASKCWNMRNLPRRAKS